MKYMLIFIVTTTAWAKSTPNFHVTFINNNSNQQDFTHLTTKPTPQMVQFSRMGMAKISSAIIGCFASVMALEYSFLYTWFYKHDGWRTWKKEIPLLALRELNEQEIIPELLMYVQMRHQQTGVNPMLLSLEDIKKERAKLTKLCRYTNLLATLGLARTASQQIIDQLTRLDFIESTLTAWIAKKIAV